jgi:hypothetical protein
MKTTIEFIKKYSLVILAITFCILSLSQTSCGKQSKPQQSNITQLNKENSKTDSLNTVKANAMLQQKDSIIKVLISKLKTEKNNTAKHKAEARKQHTLNDALQTRFGINKELSTCEDLVHGLKVEIIEKDSVVQSLDSEIETCNNHVKILESKLTIQSEIIYSKQNLIAIKDSTINHLATQKKKADFWNKVKIKAAGAVILFESIILLVK